MPEGKISKHKTYGFVYGIRTKTPIGRLAWPSLVTAKESTFPVEPGKEKPPPRFEATYLWSKKDKEVKAFIANLETMKDEMVTLFNSGGKKGAKIAVDEVLKDGDEMDTEKYPYYAGMYYLVAKHKDRPQIFDASVNVVEPKNVLGGMPALAIITPICTATGMSFKLEVVQLAKDDGVRFAGGATDSKDMLEALGGQADEEEFEDEDDDDVELPPTPVATKSKKSAKGELNLNKLG